MRPTRHLRGRQPKILKRPWCRCPSGAGSFRARNIPIGWEEASGTPLTVCWPFGCGWMVGFFFLAAAEQGAGGRGEPVDSLIKAGHAAGTRPLWPLISDCCTEHFPIRRQLCREFLWKATGGARTESQRQRTWPPQCFDRLEQVSLCAENATSSFSRTDTFPLCYGRPRST